MANGTLGTPLTTSVSTNQVVYTVPASKVATVNFNACNTSASTAKVRIGISSTGTPAAADWVEYDVVLRPAGDASNGNVLERSGFVMEAGKNLVVFSDTAGVVVRAHGFEG